MLWMYAPARAGSARRCRGDRRAAAVHLGQRRQVPVGERGSFISAMNTVIAPTVNVGRCRSTSVEHRRRVEAVASTSFIGTSSDTVMWAMIPVMWNSGATPSTQSSGVERHPLAVGLGVEHDVGVGVHRPLRRAGGPDV